jgi:hypothetical protein
VWISDLISMASTSSQPIAHNYPHASIVELGFQFSEPPPSSDASVFDCAARVNLSAMDVLESEYDRHIGICVRKELACECRYSGNN